MFLSPPRGALRSLMLLALGFALACSHGRPGGAIRPVILACETKGIRPEVAVNGAWTTVEGNDTSAGTILNGLLWPGTNHVRIRSSLAKPPTDARLSCKIYSGLKDEPLAMFNWPSPDAPAATLDHELTFEVSSPLPGQVWTHSSPIELDEAARASVLSAVEKLHQAFALKDGEAIAAMLAFSQEEAGRVAGLNAPPPDPIGGDWKQTAAGLSTEPWKPDRAEVTLGANGLLAHVAVGGHAPIVFLRGDRRIGLQIFLAQVNGHWIVARHTYEPMGSGRPAGPIYTLSCQRKGLPLLVSLNDVRIVKSTAAASSGLVQTINPWMHRGKNRLRVRIPNAPRDDSQVQVHCTVSLDKPGDVVSTEGDSTENALASFNWPPLGGKARLPFEKTLEFSADDMPVSELWKNAKRIRLDARSKAAILKVVGELHSALSTRDAERIAALTDFRGADSVRCMGGNVEMFRSTALGNAKQAVQQLEGVTFDPWQPRRAKIELEAQGLLAHVTLNGEAAIAGHAKEKDAGKISFDVYVANVNGAWVIAR